MNTHHEVRPWKEAWTSRVGRYREYTPLNVSITDLYIKVGQVERFPKLKDLKIKANTNRSSFSEYHNGFRHMMEDCYDLRDVVEQLIQEDRLAKCITSQRSPRKKRASPTKDEEKRNPRHQRTPEQEKVRESNEDNDTITRTIDVIARGFVGGGTTKSTLKRYL